MSLSLPEAAARLVADLMPIAIVVASTDEPGTGEPGTGEPGTNEPGTNEPGTNEPGTDGPGQEAAFLAALEQAGAGAERFSRGLAGGFDLAILLAGGRPPADPAIPALIEALAAISDRLLFVPGAGSDPDLDAWFELFAEQSYQPVVDYDANFLGQGAFLVDRNATAAEADLSAFAERLSTGGALAASSQRVAVLEAELGTTGDREAIKAELTARKAELTARQADLAAAVVRENTWRARAEAAESELAAVRIDLAGWQGVANALGDWIRAACAAPDRSTLAALRAAAGKKRRGLLGRLRRPKPGRVEKQQLADAALVRASTLFDPGWYIASHPELASGAADPVWHYILRGAREGADPGPWFDTAAYRDAHPEAIGNPLAHAIRHGHVDRRSTGRRAGGAVDGRARVGGMSHPAQPCVVQGCAGPVAEWRRSLRGRRIGRQQTCLAGSSPSWRRRMPPVSCRARARR